MLYQPETRSVIEVVAPGAARSDGELAALAKLLGTDLQAGQPVERVVVTYLGGAAEANAQLASIKRFGLQCRAFDDNGVETVLFEGVRIAGTGATDAGRRDGPLYPILRDASWPHLATTVHRRLLSGIPDSPWVTYGWDGKTAIVRFATADRGARTMAEVEAEAVANLAACPFEPMMIKPSMLGLPGEYCSEALLIPAVMQRCAQQIGCELMLVAVPRAARLMATRADDFGLAGELLRWSRETFDAAKGRRISPTPFLVQADGQIVGVATSPSSAEPEPTTKKKPWFKFW